jgi:hypothetical protein
VDVIVIRGHAVGHLETVPVCTCLDVVSTYGFMMGVPYIKSRVLLANRIEPVMLHIV